MASRFAALPFPRRCVAPDLALSCRSITSREVGELTRSIPQVDRTVRSIRRTPAPLISRALPTVFSEVQPMKPPPSIANEFEKLGGRVVSEVVARTLADAGVDVAVGTRVDGGEIYVTDASAVAAYELLLEMILDGVSEPPPWDRRSWQASLLASDIPHAWPNDAAFARLRAWASQLDAAREEQILPALEAVLRTGETR